MSASAPLHVLIIDDDPDTRANLCDILHLDGHTVENAGSVAEVLARRQWEGVSAIILDRRLPDGNAEELLPRLRILAPKAAILIVTGYSDLQGVIAALRQGAADYILKPINPEALRASLLRVADRQHLAREKARSEAAFRTLVEAAPTLILLLHPDRTLLYLNRFAEELTGWEASDVVGKDSFFLFLPEEAHVSMNEQLRRVLAGQIARGVELPLLCRDGSRRWVLWNAQLWQEPSIPPMPVVSPRPMSQAVLAIGQDITALKHSQERTLQSERLAAIGQMMTGLAHESGNALARSQACLEMLALELQDRPEVLELLGRIQNAQNHLQQLYDEVRNYAAPLKPERETWALDACWRQAWNNLSVRRQGRNAHLHEEMRGVRLECWIDPFRIEQVFRNIFENSLAACADPVHIRVQCKDTTLEGQPALEVRVTDNGPGLTPEALRRLFEPFFTTKTKGTGLGMAIAKRIVEAHSGQIRADSLRAPSGAGATIYLLLPRDAS
ncbi:MAG: ATP-binding protein [Gemmataceae bacterium]